MIMSPAKPRTKKANSVIYYCVLPVAEQPGQLPRYLGRCLYQAAVEFVAGTVHGHGKTEDEAFLYAVDARRRLLNSNVTRKVKAKT